MRCCIACAGVLLIALAACSEGPMQVSENSTPEIPPLGSPFKMTDGRMWYPADQLPQSEIDRYKELFNQPPENSIAAVPAQPPFTVIMPQSCCLPPFPPEATVTQVNASTWYGMTAAQFAAYDVVAVPEYMFFNPFGNKNTWGAAGTGNVMIATTHMPPHGGNFAADQLYLQNTLRWASAGAGTGVAVWAAYGWISPNPVPTVGKFAGVTTASTFPCATNTTLMDTSHPVFDGIASNAFDYGCHAHDYFNTFGSLQVIHRQNQFGSGPGGAVVLASPACQAAPTVTASVSPNQLWPPNHKYVKVTLTYSVNDPCGNAPATASAVSSEADEGLGDGDTTGDIKAGATVSSNASPVVNFNPATAQLELRAERSGNGNGRTYTITISATNSAGTGSATATVTVPHNK